MTWNNYCNSSESLETRFAVEDGMAFLDSVFDELSDESKNKINQIKVFLDDLPPLEADFVELYYFRKLKQTEIADLYKVSQPTVCYRLQRAAARIHFLLEIPKPNETQLLQDISSVLSEPLDQQIMYLMWATTCQSQVAKTLGVSQGLVRYRFLRGIERLIKYSEELKLADSVEQSTVISDYAKMFEFISNHLNILWGVQKSSREEKPVLYVID